MTQTIEQLRARIAELEKQLSELRIELITSYGESEELSGEVAAVKKQRDDLLAALEKFVDSHEECTDFDGFTAQIVSMDDYHEARGAIASVKEQA